MSTDTYHLDRLSHGRVHIDRRSKEGKTVGRYQLNGTPIRHKGKRPPPIPIADFERFRKVSAKA